MEAIRAKTDIQAPLWEVYEIMSTLGGLRSWLTRDAQGDPAKGGTLTLGFGPERTMVMQVGIVRKNAYISWVLTDSTFPASESGQKTKIVFRLCEGEGRGTNVELEHSGWTDTNEFYRVSGYLWEQSLLSLKKVCETGRGEPITPAVLTTKKATGWFPVM